MLYSIKSKLIFFTILLLAIISILIFIYFPEQYEEIQLASLMENSKITNNLISYSLSPALYFEDIDNINEVLAGAGRNRNISYIVLQDNHDLVAEYNFGIADLNNYTYISILPNPDSLIYKTKEPVIHNGKVIGYLYAGYSLKEIRETINNSRYVIAVISVIVFLAGSLILYLISIFSLRSLNSIIETTKEVSAGKMNMRAKVTNDEIGNVAVTFNNMMENLQLSQDKLKSWNKDLENSIQERTRDLQKEIEERKKTEIELIKAKEEAEEMNRLKTSFLANMSHEIRTPLNGILGFSSILKGELTNEVHKDILEKIRISGNRLYKTINSIIDLSIIESKSIVLNLKTVNIVEEIKNVVNLLKPLTESKNLFLKFSYGKPSIFANLDDHSLYQILNNLIGNAIKFTSEGGIVVEAGELNEGSEKFAVVTVTDTGIGIPEKYHSLIFEEFRQVSEGLSRQYEGTGLGLTITKNLVKVMNGKIDLISEEGNGSTFILKFPAI